MLAFYFEKRLSIKHQLTLLQQGSIDKYYILERLLKFHNFFLMSSFKIIFIQSFFFLFERHHETVSGVNTLRDIIVVVTVQIMGSL